MQRRLTKNEVWKIGRAYDSLHGLTPPIDSTAARDCRMLLQDMLTHNTTDGRPYVDPPLTDEDARQRPWVMVRDCEDHEWSGPRKLAAVTPQAKTKCYYILSNDGKTITTWDRCRRATLAELVGAGLEVTE